MTHRLIVYKAELSCQFQPQLYFLRRSEGIIPPKANYLIGLQFAQITL
jgi:hypothetical protein